MSDRRGKETHDDMWDSGTHGLITRIAVVAALAELLFGFDTGVISGALGYIGGAFNLGDIGKSAVVSSVLLGAVVSSLVAMAIIDGSGRRRSLFALELFPVGVRGGAASIATVVRWLGNLFIAFTFLSLLDLVGESATFFSYAAVAVLGSVFVWFLVAETKGRTLEEIEEGFISRAKARLKD